MPISAEKPVSLFKRGAVVLLAAGMLLFGGVALAQEAEPPAAVPERDAEAMGILLRMADYLAKVPALSVTVLSSYDAIQEDGEFIEFGARRRILLQRPDRMRVDIERSDGDKGMVLFDGKEIVAFKPADNVFATVARPGTTDEAMVYLVRDLQVQLPLARLFLAVLPQELEKQVKSISYVETDALSDVPTDHLAVRSDEVDFQIWIAQGDTPLPRRLVITYKDAPGQPQFRADLTDWSLKENPGETFVFTPPAGAEKVPFVIPARSQKTAAPAEGGAK